MKLRDSFDGNTRFEGDRALQWRSIPANARIVSAKATVTPVDANLGGPFAEPLSFNGGTGEFGATKTVAGTWVEVDFHSRRTLASVTGRFNNTTLQVDVGGGTYVEINKAGAFKTPSDAAADLFQLTGNFGALPGLTVAKLKLTNANGSPGLTAVIVRSVPTNVRLRLGDLSPFWTHVGEMTQPETTPDFTAVLQAALTSAKVANGFYDLPLVIHSDTIARLQVELEVEFLAEANPLPQGLQEVVLPFDFSTLAQSQAAVLNVAVPANMRVVPGQTTARVRGAFAPTRIAYGPTGAVTPAAAIEVSPACSQAQIIALDDAVSATAVDLLIGAVTPAARLRLDLRADLDGKPGDDSLLSGTVEFKLDQETSKQPRWTSVPLPTEFLFEKAQGTKPRYWLVLQSLEGTATWSVAKAAPGALNMQCTRDGGLSWRDTVALGKTLRDNTVPVAGPFAAFFRLRRLPARFEVPIELQAGTGDRAVRVKLDRFEPLGRVDFVLDAELAQGINQHLDKAGLTTCPEKEHLINGDFEHWLRVGDNLMRQPAIELGASLSTVAVTPDGALAYVAGTESGKTTVGVLQVMDVACNEKIDSIGLDSLFPVALAISPAMARAYVASDQQLQAINTNTRQTLGAPINLRGGTKALALSPDGRWLYVTEYFYIGGDNGGSVRAIDTDLLEQVVRGQLTIAQAVIATPSFGLGQEPIALAATPDGSQLCVTIINHNQNKQGIVQIINTTTYQQLSAPIPVGTEPRGIALTPDGKWAVVANAGANTVSVIDTVTRAVSLISVGQSPIAVAISSDGTRAYVLNQVGGSVSIIDLSRRAVVKEFPVGTGKSPTALALTPQGDQIYVASTDDSNSLSSIQFGTQFPVEWHLTSGAVSPFCLPTPFHLVALLGSASTPTAISQVVPVAESCPYEFSFWGIAKEPETNEPPAVAEVLWLSRDCGLLRADQVPIDVQESSPAGSGGGGGTSGVSGTVAQRLPLVLHRKSLTAPAGAEQAEVRFSVPTGGEAVIDLVSLIATAETVANADFRLLQDGQLADWTLSPGVAPGVSVLEADGGIQVQNAGAATAELTQTVAARGDQLFVLEFQSRASTRPSAQTNPRLELHWLKADNSLAGSPTVLQILPAGLDSSAASGTTPTEATQVEIHLVVPAGTTQKVNRISLRFSTPTAVPVTFIAQAPGELTVSDLRVAFEQVEPPLPQVPDRGLCIPTPPGRQPGETSNDCCFCHHCESEQTLVETKPVVTSAGRPALVGRCATCGNELVRFGGPRTPGAQSFPLRRLSATQPIVIRSQTRISDVTVGRTPLTAETAVITTLTAISGIGEVRARQLTEIGIDSLEKLAAASPQDVAQIKGVDVEMAAQFISQAKELVASRKRP